MDTDDASHPALKDFNLLNAYLGRIGRYQGMGKALALDAEILTALGAAEGKSVKERTGLDEVDIHTAREVLVQDLEDTLGIQVEITRETPVQVSFRIRRCPIYESARALGMEGSTIEAICRAGAVGYMNAMARQLNPKLRFRLERFRSDDGEPCQGTIRLD
jgi:hypothetical protein